MLVFALLIICFSFQNSAYYNTNPIDRGKKKIAKSLLKKINFTSIYYEKVKFFIDNAQRQNLVNTIQLPILKQNIISRIKVSGLDGVNILSFFIKVKSILGKKYSRDFFKNRITFFLKLKKYVYITVLKSVSENQSIILTFFIKKKETIRKILVLKGNNITNNSIDNIELKENDIFNFIRIKETKLRILEWYIEKGFFLAEIKINMIIINNSIILLKGDKKNFLFIVNFNKKKEAI